MNRYLRDRARKRMRRDRARGRDYADRHYHMTSYPMYDDHDYAEHRGYDYARHRDLEHDYARRRDYAMDEEYDLADEWDRDLEEWCAKLKHHDRFGMHKDQVIHNAKQMGVDFRDYNEKEFVVVYYMLMSDFPKIANEPHTYISMAKEWLEDKDSMLKGSERLCAYYYEIVKGGED